MLEQTLAFPPKPTDKPSVHMAGKPRPSSFALDVLEVLRRLQSVGFCLDVDASVRDGSEPPPGKMAALFERILCLFFQEIARKEKEEIRSFPALLGDGRSVDLFRLYGTVREKGGYKSVTSGGLWGSVADEVGLGSAVGSALKLIYVKYLDVLDRWLLEVLVRETGGTVGREEPVLVFDKADKDGRGSSHAVWDEKSGGDEGTPLSSKEHSRTTLKGCNLKEQLDNGAGDDDVVVLEPVDVSAQCPSVKRKRESFFGVLDWLRKVARNPGNPIVSMLLDRPESPCHAVKEPFSLVLLAREAMFAKVLHVSETDASLSQKRQKAHPSLYDGYPVSDLTNEKLRCSQRIISLKKKLQSASCPDVSAVSDGESDKDFIESGSEGICDRRHSRDQSLPHAGISAKDRKCITIGPDHQAKIPVWTGRDSGASNDANVEKFLGTRVWPLERKEQKLFIKQDPIGRGRQDNCGCERCGSVECVRFHVSEKRFHLKRELGSAFYAMGFNHMGEEVSLSWTKEEEQKFKATVLQNPPSVGNTFWDLVFLCFPFKTRPSLVSYYFNVFILQRRSYQNRVTPQEIDSDDDESEFCFLSNSFGRNAVEVRNPKSIICVQNAQCVNLDDSTDSDND